MEMRNNLLAIEFWGYVADIMQPVSIIQENSNPTGR